MAINPIYTAAATGPSFALDKCVLGLHNGAGSGKILRIYRIWALNNQTAAVTGIVATLSLCRFSTGSGGLPLTPLRHDTADPALPAQIICSTGMNYTVDARFRHIRWSTDEPIAGTGQGIDEIQTVPSLNMLWDSSYAYINENLVQPMVLREGQGIGIVVTAISGAVAGSGDFFIEFTSGAT